MATLKRQQWNVLEHASGACIMGVSLTRGDGQWLQMRTYQVVIVLTLLYDLCGIEKGDSECMHFRRAVCHGEDGEAMVGPIETAVSSCGNTSRLRRTRDPLSFAVGVIYDDGSAYEGENLCVAD